MAVSGVDARGAGGDRLSYPILLLIGALDAATIGITVAGTSSVPAVWLVALLGIAVGVGAGNTGSTGVLLDVVPPERIVLAMVVWSQVGIVGYVIGPLLGGVLAEAAGFRTLGLIPAIIGALLVVQLRRLTLASSR
jgi:MFS family permease